MPQLHKIECKWRFRFGTKTFKVTQGGATTLDCEDGWAETFAELAAQVQTQLQTVSGSFTCAVASPGKVTIAHSGPTNFTIDWDDRSLATALGFDGTQLTGAATYTSTTQSPLVFQASLPWSGDRPGLIFSRMAPKLYRKTKRSIKLGKIRTWSLTARVTGDEIDQWRKVANLLSSGIPARWSRNDSDAAAWTWANFDGYVDVVLSPNVKSLNDMWPGFPVRQHLVQDLAFVEWLNNESEGEGEGEGEGFGGGGFGGG